ncbi:MAG: CvpA family protein [Pseudomonadota bacterium]
MTFTIIDGGVAVITLLSGILAYTRGFTREILAIGGWIIAAALAFYFTPQLEPLVREVPVLGDFLAGSCVLSTITAFTLIVAAALLLLSVFTPVFANAVLDSVIGPVDRALGFLFGIVRGIALIAIAYMIYTNLSGGAEEWEPLANAGSRVFFDELVLRITEYLPTEMPPWFAERIDALMAPCSAELPEGGLTLPDSETPVEGSTTGGEGATTEGTTGN